MKYQDDFGAAKVFAERAFRQLDESRTPPTPENFELFYVHASGANPDLSSALNSLLESEEGPGGADFESLYGEHLGNEGLSSRLEEMARSLARMIQETMRTLTSARASGGATDQQVARTLAQLGPDSTPQQLCDCMQQVLQLAQGMKETNAALEANFATSMAQIGELNHCLQVARAEASIDPVTGVANRGSFDRRILEAVSRASTLKQNLSLLMIDMDRFKALNDRFGHQTGDAVLRILGHMIRSNIKGQDLAARYGGEEFAVILPETTLAQAYTVAEKIRKAVRSKTLHRKSTGETLGRITISVGIAQFNQNDTAKSLIARADKCLYAAKHGGRDCVKFDADPEVPRLSEPLRTAV